MTATLPYARDLPQPAAPFPPPVGGQPEERRSCFVIGPIGDRHASVGSPARQAYESALQVFEKVIHPACSLVGLEPVRADQISHTGEITEQICRRLLESELVIADVSGGNPNVMYELGLRHTTGRPVVHLGEFDRLPFDIAPIRTIKFERTRSGLIEARDELAETLARALHEGFTPLTPARILRGLPATTEETAHGTGSGRDGAEEDAPGLLERFAELEPGMEAMAEDLTAMTSLITNIAELAEKFGPDMQRVARDGSPMSAQLAVTRRLATAMGEPAAELKATACRFTDRMTQLDSSIHAALDLYEKIPPTLWSTDDHGFLSQLVGISGAAREGAQTLALFRTVVDVMIAMHRELRGPANDIATAVHQLGDAMTKVGIWDHRARALLT
ncbi:hypothetical protein [Kitasatospora sp. NPDC091207]|uniref:hypothetical protein n=1 Tax=Kitasatospora sp. NPDC091207 TaxID=3364083 RepID=UPI003823768E